jgi:hypothetical protein
MEMANLETLVMSVIAFILISYFLYKSISSGYTLISIAIIVALIVTFILVGLYKRGIKKQAEAHDDWFEIESAHN